MKDYSEITAELGKEHTKLNDALEGKKFEEAMVVNLRLIKAHNDLHELICAKIDDNANDILYGLQFKIGKPVTHQD